MSAPVSARKVNQILRAHNAASLQGITLRDYQRDAIDGVLAEVRKSNRRVLLVAPTGAGKTVMFSALAMLFHAAGLRVLVVAHRKELIEQAVRKLRASGVAKVGVWRGKKNSSETDAQVMVAAIQALRSAKIDADLVIVDEAQHTGAPSWRELLDLYPNAVHVGATATPWWGDGQGLGHYFNAIVTATTVRDLTDAGHLARVRMFTHPHTLRDLDLRGVKTSGGDYQTAALSERVDRPNLLGDIVEHWTTHANGARSLVFAASVEHSQHVAARFRAAGIAAEHLDGTTPEDQRDAMLARLRNGETRVVSNYNILCLDEQTEILTSEGWVGIDAMTPEHLVANWRADAPTTFERPIKVMRRELSDGERMASLVGRSVDIRVTEGHDIIHRSNVGCFWTKRKARDLIGAPGDLPACGRAGPRRFDLEPPSISEAILRRLRTATRWNLRHREGYSPEAAVAEAERRVARKAALRHKAPHELSIDECRLIGFWLGDGSRTELARGGTEFVLHESTGNPQIVAWVDSLLSRLGMDSARRELPAGKSSTKSFHRTHDLVRWGIGRGTGGGSQERNGVYAIENYLVHEGSDLCWGLDSEQFDALLEGLWLADGDHGQGGIPLPHAFCIHGARKALLDRLQAIAAVRSWRTRLAATGRDGMYRLSFTRREHFSIGTQRFEFDATVPMERVWCVRVHSGAIITRRNGCVAVLGNCEGFDAPSVGCVILARPTQRLGVYLQAVGRGLRIEAEKPSVVVLDHAGLCLRFGLPDEERPCSLECTEESETTGEPRVRRCPECGLCVPVATRVCPECAESLRRAERVLTEEPRGALVEIVCGSSAGPHMITCNGKTLTRSQWAVELNMSPSLVTFRVNKGIPLDAPVARKERITFNGRSLFITEWAEEIGIDPESLRLRIRSGMTLEEALSKPSTQVKRLTYKGKTMTVGEWAKEIGISESAIHFRLRRGLPIEQVLAPPKSYARHTKITRAGETQTLEEWARRIDVSVSIILRRIRGGASPEEALAPTATVAARVAKSMTTRRQSLDLITYQGRSMPAYAWAKEIGVSASTIRRRRAEGLPVEKVLAPATASAERTARAAEGRRRSAKKLKVGGVELTLPQWAKRVGVSTATIERRLARGMAPEECVATGGGRAS